MNKFIIFLVTFVSLNTFAQIDPGYKYFYKETTLETDDYKIYIEDGMAVDGKAKLKVRIFNKTNDYIVFKPSDVLFKINGKDLPCEDKPIFVIPNDEATRVIDAKGKGLQVNKFSVEIKNLYKVASNTPVIKAADYNIPVTVNGFTAGNFKCITKTAAVKSDKTLFKFVCTYEGDQIGILAPSKITAIMPKGQENVNTNRNKGMLLEKGKSDDFLVDIREIAGSGDMQKDSWKLKWNETFRESKEVIIPGGKFDMELDPTKTSEKNK
jgi:hypothetical protein